MSAKQPASNHLGKYVHRFIRSIWLFPALLTVLLLTMTALGISGTSVGIYKDVLGQPQERSTLIYNQPRPIRSDEWLFVTQMTVGQAANNYRPINDNIGNGQDMSLLTSVPVKDWPLLFHPENWAFFVIPFDNAFAFKWWFFGYMLALAVYFLVLKLLPNRRAFAALLGGAMLFSPFVQWWYQYATLAPIYYSLLIALVSLAMFERQTRLKRLLLMSALVYVATAFSMVLYPPFQIACCFGVAALLVGFLLETLRVESVKTVLRRVATIVISLAIALCITGLFLLQHKASADALVHTSYPGQRVEHGGNYEADKVFTGFLDRGLLSENSSITFGLNQSENSNFITLLPLLFLPSLFLIFKQYRNKKQLDWPLLLTNVAALLVVVRLLTPVIDPLFRLVLFDKVPSSRLIAAFAVLSVLQLALYVRAQQRSPKPRLWQILVYLVAVVAALVALMLYVHSAYPEFLRLRWELGAAGIMTTILALILFRKIELAALALFAFSILSTAQVHPLYRGLSPLTDGQIASTIKATHEKDPDGKWITESVYFENLPQAYGAPSLSGIFYYPQKQVWSSVDSGRSSSIYNRYAHVGYTLDTDPSVNVKTHFKLVQDDSFTIISEPCSPFLKRHNVRYILTQTLFTDHCLTKIKTLSYPNLVLYVYRIQ